MMSSNNAQVYFFKFDENGVPLIPYCPPNPMPLPPDFNADITWESIMGAASYQTVDSWNSSTLRVCRGATPEEVMEGAARLVELMKDWRQAAKEMGHEYPELIYDGYGVYPVYYRQATLEETVALKMQARINRKILEQSIQKLQDVLKSQDEFDAKFPPEEQA